MAAVPGAAADPVMAEGAPTDGLTGPDDALAAARTLAAELTNSAAERDAAGGTARRERDRVRASGLLRLIVPREHGGLGATWSEALQVTRTVAAADGSLAHLLGYHYLEAATPHAFGTPDQRARAYRETARENLFWGNALNPLDPRTTLAPEPDGGFRLDGAKSFCSGAADSDRLLVSATYAEGGGLAVTAIPTRRAGVHVQDDWDNMGQRQTDSGSVRFEQVRVEPDEVLGPPGPGGSVFATLRTCVVQLILANVLLGIGQGALQTARAYTRERARAWSAGEPPTRDPDVLRRYGDLWLDLEAAEALVERAGASLDEAWALEDALTAEQRGACAIAVSAAKVAATRASLSVSSSMFEVMGARATTAAERFDRFWRNARTLSLHDPVDRKLRDLGEWALNDTYPTPGFYS